MLVVCTASVTPQIEFLIAVFSNWVLQDPGIEGPGLLIRLLGPMVRGCNSGVDVGANSPCAPKGEDGLVG